MLECRDSTADKPTAVEPPIAADSNPRRWPLIFGCSLVVFLTGAFIWTLVYAFGNRDTWEFDNYSQIIAKYEAVYRAIAKSHREDAELAYEELKQFIGNHKIESEFLATTLADVDHAMLRLQPEINRLRAAREAKRERVASLKGQAVPIKTIESPAGHPDATSSNLSDAQRQETIASLRAEFASKSAEVQDAIRAAYRFLMTAKDQPASSNPFVQERLEKELASATEKFETAISTPIPIDGWIVFANKVVQNDNGETTVETVLVIYTKRDGSVRSMDLKCIVQNHACLGKVKSLPTPCFVKLYGRYTGTRETETYLENEGVYTLLVHLDDIEDLSIQSLSKRAPSQ